MATRDDERKFWVNRHAMNAAASGGLASVARPEAGDYIGQYPLYWLLAITCIGSGVLAVRGLLNRRARRRILRNAHIASGALGDARFATLAELHAAGLTNPENGHLLCTVNGVPIFAPPQTHYCLAGPPGSGKTTSIAVNAIAHLAHLGFSVCVQDIKPELCHILAAELKRRGFRIVINDVAGLSGFKHTDSNPFCILIDEVSDTQKQSRTFITAEGFAYQITKEPENDGKNRYFRDLERGLFVILSVGLAVLAPELCQPGMLWRTAADPDECHQLLLDASQSDALHGDVGAQARNYLALMRDQPEHYEGARVGLAQSLSAFRPSSDLGAVGTAHEFHPNELRDESKPPVILFDVVPSASLETYGRAIALQQYARLSVLKQVGGRRVAFCMDECTNLSVNQLAKDITLLRSRGIILMMLYQSLSELKRVFGEKSAATITANSAEQFLQISDWETADLVSKRIGDHTVRTSGFSYAHRDGQGSTSTSEHAKRLMPPDEVLAMGRDETLVFIPGLRPIRGRKVAYYHVSPIKDWAAANPHEPYPKSPITRLAFKYANSAKDLTPPEVIYGRRHIEDVLKAETKSKKPPRIPLLEARSFIWLPVVAACWLFLHMQGTPHVLFEYQTQPDYSGHSNCTYVGLSGVRRARVHGSCLPVSFFRGGAKS